MKKILSIITAVAGLILSTACADTDAQYVIPDVGAPTIKEVIIKTLGVRDSVHFDGTSTTITMPKQLKPGNDSLYIAFDKNIGMYSGNASKITINGVPVTNAVVEGISNELLIVASVPAEGVITLNIPAGIVIGPNKVPLPEVNITWDGLAVDITTELANPNANQAAKDLYATLLRFYGKKTLSATMAQVNWNNQHAERIYSLTGKYPAITTYDYIHLAASGPSSWINYGDITPAKQWADAGGIVAASWHWNVPVSEPKDDPQPTPGGEETAIWEGIANLGVDWDGTLAVVVPADKCADIKNGTKMTFYYRQNSDNTYWQIKGMDGGWATLTSYADVDNGWGCIPLDGGTSSYTITINSADAEALKKNGLVVAGFNVTITKVAISNGSSARRRANANVELSYGPSEFSAKEAIVEGTWENEVVKADLDKIAGYLKLLQDQNIAVLWRPLHEAKGNYGVYAPGTGAWFWWGCDGPEAFKALWQYTFNYLKDAGVNNLVWVWTSCLNDNDWYPGDEYVDIVGTDIYNNNDTGKLTGIFNDLQYTYTHKMITLSECGTVSNINDQYAAGAKWSYAMPWYDNEGAASTHATDEWWKATMSSEHVITRDQLK